MIRVDGTALLWEGKTIPPSSHYELDSPCLVIPTICVLCDPSQLHSGGIERCSVGRGAGCCSAADDKVSNITISSSSPKNCYKPISEIAAIYSAKTVRSSRRQCKLLGWIMSVSFRGVYKRGSITQGSKSEIGTTVAPLPVSPSRRSGHKMVPSHAAPRQHREQRDRRARRRRDASVKSAKEAKTNSDSSELILSIN